MLKMSEFQRRFGRVGQAGQGPYNEVRIQPYLVQWVPGRLAEREDYFQRIYADGSVERF